MLSRNSRVNNVDWLKKLGGLFLAAIVTIGAVITYLLPGKNRANNGRIQRDKQRIRDGSKRTDESKSINTAAKGHAESAERNIETATTCVADAQRILNQAKERSEK